MSLSRQETFAAILRHFIIARLVELGIISNANPDFNTGILTSYPVYTLEYQMGDSETTDKECVQAPTLQENTNYDKKYQSGGYISRKSAYLSKGDRWKVSGHTSVK